MQAAIKIESFKNKFLAY